jgi:hypothetical protein
MPVTSAHGCQFHGLRFCRGVAAAARCYQREKQVVFRLNSDSVSLIEHARGQGSEDAGQATANLQQKATEKGGQALRLEAVSPYAGLLHTTPKL